MRTEDVPGRIHRTCLDLQRELRDSLNTGSASSNEQSALRAACLLMRMHKQIIILCARLFVVCFPLP